jgi:hypothetical protein
MRLIIRNSVWLIIFCGMAIYALRDHQNMKVRIAQIEEEWSREKAQFANNYALIDLKVKSIQELDKLASDRFQRILQVSDNQAASYKPIPETGVRFSH